MKKTSHATPAVTRESSRLPTSLHKSTGVVTLFASQPRAAAPPVPTKQRPMIISASELRTWLRCRVQHAWRYQLKLVPREGKEALGIGILVHELLEAWYTVPFAKRSVKAMVAIVTKRLQETIPQDLDIESVDLVRAMAVGYAKWALVDDATIGLRECIPEKWFEEPLTPDGSIIVRGKVDNIFTPTNLKHTLASQETKTAAQIKTDHIDLMLQISVYLWAMRRMFPKYRRYQTHFTVLRKQMPGPRVTAPLFAREVIERSDDEIEQWATDTQHACRDMIGAAIYPNPMDSCSWSCDFKVPCLLRGNQSDLTHVLTTQYQTKEYTK